LDLIDNLYYRIQRRMPVSNMAAADVIAKLTDAIDALPKNPEAPDDYEP
jgi:hypothetical protein